MTFAKPEPPPFRSEPDPEVEDADPVLVTDEILTEGARMRELADQYVVIS